MLPLCCSCHKIIRRYKEMGLMIVEPEHGWLLLWGLLDAELMWVVRCWGHRNREWEDSWLVVSLLSDTTDTEGEVGAQFNNPTGRGCVLLKKVKNSSISITHFLSFFFNQLPLQAFAIIAFKVAFSLIRQADSHCEGQCICVCVCVKSCHCAWVILIGEVSALQQIALLLL